MNRLFTSILALCLGVALMAFAGVKMLVDGHIDVPGSDSDPMVLGLLVVAGSIVFSAGLVTWVLSQSQRD